MDTISQEYLEEFSSNLAQTHTVNAISQEHLEKVFLKNKFVYLKIYTKKQKMARYYKVFAYNKKTT